MKKKYSATLKDKEDWLNYLEQIKNIPEKTFNFKEKIFNTNKVKKLDLHGFSLDEANIEGVVRDLVVYFVCSATQDFAELGTPGVLNVGHKHWIDELIVPFAVPVPYAGQ